MNHNRVSIDRFFIPDAFVNFVCGKNTSGIAHQKQQDFKLNGRQAHRRAIDKDFYSLFV